MRRRPAANAPVPAGGAGRPPCFILRAAAGGIAAAVVSTAVQIALWLAFTDDFPAILWRDTRLTAALLMERSILDASGPPDWPTLALATAIHLALSLAYGLALCAFAQPLGKGWVPLAVAAGGGLYWLNLHGFTLLFPWFAVARGGITLAAHIAFALTAVATCRALSRSPLPIIP